MMQNKILNTSLAAVGEDIGPELGAKMVKDFQDAYPTENPWVFCGKDILQKILNQPDCQGVRFYHAIDELGRRTLVSVGINSQEEIISEYSAIDAGGIMKREIGIVADRNGIPKPGTKSTSTTTDLDWW
ncbi:hypothetical protein [Flavihumibacter sp. CACIAM 22H1]|uniref:hypothetical protein n=1 Tax=Flavihumibacter sp. CACIAM 22H1 TaxID=1812911 RepID=UPI0007A89B20|nr:hypothetical protein [Flavihumibacter sp. CACIAM 22H1]KYP14680.1 MAG: hypothetical protein A1D16_09785 [Flavihumibacter sp. CACIAM 22H1]